MTDDDELLTAEYALGLLSADEARAVESRLRLDGPLSLRVAWWRDQFGPLADSVAVEPPAGLWSAIEARLGANDNSPPVNRWRWATVGMSAVAAVLLGFIVLRPLPTPVVVPPAAAPMIAAVAGTGGTVAISYDSTGGRLTVVPTTLDTGSGDAELWIIPEGDTPHSLGVVDARSMQVHEVPLPMRPMVHHGATLAITREAKGGSPTGAPQGPIVAQGKISRT